MVHLGKTIDTSVSTENLREERRRTGKFVAIGAAIFLSLIGLHQALTRGNPGYAALFAPALIMFVYIAWVLYVSTRRRIIFKDNTDLLEVSTVNSLTPRRQSADDIELSCKNETADKELPQHSQHTYSRSYSIG